jgi:CheY-like chemotaxis protein
MSRDRPLIILADDEAPIIELLGELFTEEGYDTVCCFSGKEAYQAIQRELPDFVILDMQMEQRDAGIIVLSMMRLNPTTVNIPVIICSANGLFLREKQPQLQGYHCDVLEKPFILSELLVKVRLAIGKPC